MPSDSPPPDPRRYPDRPFLAVSTAIFRDGQLLLAARGKPPMLGIYTLPGGMVETGETLEQAARREVAEEVGLDVAIVGFAGHVEIIRRDAAGAVERHAVVNAFAAHWSAGEPQLSDEATDIRWVDPDTLGGLPVTDGLPAIIAAARRLVGI
jgi:ADP-ribose pyrophosphatase YjhB (NUDIX family)